MRSRREFLFQAVGTAAVSVGLPLPTLWRCAAAAAEANSDLPALVVLELTGGNDGLNTVVPYADDVYHKSRPTLRVPSASVLKCDDRVGLHPVLKEMYRLWDGGKVKVVQNTGYPNQDRSHFSSMDTWHAGILLPRHEGMAASVPTAGWLGRVGDAHPALGRCYVGTEVVPLAVQGRKEPAAALANLSEYQSALDTLVPPGAGSPGDPLLGQIKLRMESTEDLMTRITKVTATLPVTTPGSLEERLLTIKALLEAVPRFRVFYTSLAGFDTHYGQQGTHEDLLQTLSTALFRFQDELKRSKLDDRVVVLIFSEFGRRLRENGNRGTDHGTSAPVFLVGKRVRGGLLGPAPDLNDLESGDPRYKIDFRDVYATVLRQWLRVDPEPILGKRNDALPVFTA